MATTQYDLAASHLGTKALAKKPVKALKELHVKELHDGSFHVMMQYGRDHNGMEVKPSTEGSAHDLDGVHDHLEEHFGTANAKEEKGESGEK